MLKLDIEYTVKWSMNENLTELWELLITDNKTTLAKCGVRCIRPNREDPIYPARGIKECWRDH